MTTANRDPRVDPRPGDVVRLELNEQREVVCVSEKGGVRWREPPFIFERSQSGSDWRRDCANAEIVKAAP